MTTEKNEIFNYLMIKSELIRQKDKDELDLLKNELLNLTNKKDTPFITYWICRNIINGPCEELEDFILQSSKWSYYYSFFVLEKRWIRAEDIIFSDLLIGCYYIKDVVKERIPEFEKLLLNGHIYYALHYILDCNVVTERWLEFENRININDLDYNDTLWNQYKEYFNIDD